MKLTLNPQQIYIIKHVVNGPIPLSTWRKWNQRPIRGLWIRGFVKVSSKLELEITGKGWDVYGLSKIIYNRKHPKSNVFRRQR